MKTARKQFFNHLTQEKLKFTSQRALIFDVFWNVQDHVSPEELYRQVKVKDALVGQATVYRTLKLLLESGIAKEVDFGDGVTRYEPGFGQEHHDHLICKGCAKRVEVMDEEIEKRQVQLAESHGFTLTDHSMYLYGYCEACSKKE